MKILTWNVNGIRAMKEGINTFLNTHDIDMVCLQETKVTRDQLDEPSAIVDGYNSYFSFSKKRSGYSGVATFVKNSATPVKAEEGLTDLLSNDDKEEHIGCYGDNAEFMDDELQSLDSEGRTVITQHQIKTENGVELLTVINVYCPRADPEREDRKVYKMRFYELLEGRALAILKSGSHVIILGDVNTSHKRIDSCDPADDFETRPTRKWLDKFLWDPESQESEDTSKHQFIDSFRYYHPQQQKAYTCWSTVTGARATNYGTRIDYIFGNKKLVETQFSDCVILPDVEGSDHCPVRATLKCSILPAKKCPKLCTKYLPEFMGRQQKLSAFLSKKPKVNLCTESESDLTSSESQESLQSSSQNESSQNLKRSQSCQAKQPNKKTKFEEKKSQSGKQGTLLNFFTKKDTAKNDRKEQTLQTDIKSNLNSASNQSGSEHARQDVEPAGSGDKKDKKVVVNSWKNLLKGPPPPPLCKGHQEPCVLRTVKKDDSLNKGRQFWVCQKPDGEKGNPLARCDHFEWVEKKKKN